MKDMADLHTKAGEVFNGYATREVHSYEKGHLANLVDDKSFTLDMACVSVFDHITEPRTVSDYRVQALAGKAFTQWGLLWGEYLLGCTSTFRGVSILTFDAETDLLKLKDHQYATPESEEWAYYEGGKAERKTKSRVKERAREREVIYLRWKSSSHFLSALTH